MSCHSSVTESTASSSVFVVIPSTFKPGIEKSFQLVITSDKEVKFNRLDDSGIVEEKEEESDVEEEGEEEGEEEEGEEGEEGESDEEEGEGKEEKQPSKGKKAESSDSEEEEKK